MKQITKISPSVDEKANLDSRIKRLELDIQTKKRQLELLVYTVPIYSDDKYYAFTKNPPEYVGFITQNTYEGSVYRLAASRSVTKGNGFSCKELNSLNEAIDWLLSHGFKVYEFDDNKEFLKFLAKNS